MMLPDSTGEEPYTLTMIMDEYFGAEKELWNTRILATDISTNALETAKKAEYTNEQIEMVPANWKVGYFKRIDHKRCALIDKIRNALKAGAVDFAAKPNARLGRGVDALISELIVKIKIASTAQLDHFKNNLTGSSVVRKTIQNTSNFIIAIGASTGGTEAIFSILKQFPVHMPGIVIVQHMPPVFTKMYADRLNNSCLLKVKEAATGDRVLPGTALIAPGDYHMKLKKVGAVYSVECFKDEKVNGHCPSVDVLFESVAQKAGSDAIGVILTGMGYDGAKGLLSMRKKGAPTIGQDEQSCVVYGMPKVAYDIGAVQKQASLLSIPQLIYSILERK